MADKILYAHGSVVPLLLHDINGDGSQYSLATYGPDVRSVALVAGELHLGEIGGRIRRVDAEITRPSDTTAYTAGDAVSDSTGATTMIAIANAARVSGGSGYIVGVRLTTDKKSITPRIRVRFWNTNGATLSVDNAAYQRKYADESKYIGYVDLAAMTTPVDTTNSDTSAAHDFTIRIPYVASATTLYATYEALDAFTPASGEKFNLTVWMDQN